MPSSSSARRRSERVRGLMPCSERSSSQKGISPRTLSLRLRALEEEGIVERDTFSEVPPRVEYALTEKGRALIPIIEDMRAYGRRWLGAEGGCAPSDTR